MKIKKMILVFAFVFLGMFIFHGEALAANTIERTTMLDLTDALFDTNQSNNEEGWNWDASSNTLTLNNVNFNTTGTSALKFPGTKNINLVLIGKNKMKSASDKATIARTDTTSYDATITISGTGELEIISDESVASNGPTIDSNNLIIKSGVINAYGGAINALEKIIIEGGKVNVTTTSSSEWEDGLYACGAIEITGGTININANRIGLFVPGTGSANPLTGVKITGGKIDLLGNLSAIYAGLHNPKNIYINTTETIDFKSSPIGIFSYNGDITIESGIFKISNGVYYKISSNNTTGVINIALGDYTKVDEALTKIPNNLSIYTNDSVTALNNAINSISRNNNILEQNVIDGYVTNIENAIKGLKIKKADYSKVDSAIKKVPNNLNKYTKESVNKLNNAINSVIRGKDITEQKIVDGYAKDIEKALKGLVKVKESKSYNNKKTVKKEKNSSDNLNNIVKTGDNITLFFIIFILSLAGIIITYKTKKISN